MNRINKSITSLNLIQMKKVKIYTLIIFSILSLSNQSYAQVNLLKTAKHTSDHNTVHINGNFFLIGKSLNLTYERKIINRKYIEFALSTAIDYRAERAIIDTYIQSGTGILGNTTRPIWGTEHTTNVIGNGLLLIRQGRLALELGTGIMLNKQKTIRWRHLIGGRIEISDDLMARLGMVSKEIYIGVGLSF